MHFYSESNKFTNTLYTRSLQGGQNDAWAEAKKNLTFSSEKADYDAFETAYQRETNRNDFFDNDNVAKEWVGRKFTAIPYMIFGGLSIIYHLAQAALSCFVCSGSESSPRSDDILKYVFCVIRDMEEIYGNFICLFNDQLGLYHIQQAQFQKECYNVHISKPSEEYINSSSSPSNKPLTFDKPIKISFDAYAANSGFKHLNAEFTKKYNLSTIALGHGSGKYNAPVRSEIQKITLSDFKKLSDLEKAELSRHLSVNLTQLCEGKIELEDFLNNNTDATLELLTLEDLMFFDRSPLQFAIMDDDQLKELTFVDLEGKSGMFKVPLEEQQLNLTSVSDKRDTSPHFTELEKSKIKFLKFRFNSLLSVAFNNLTPDGLANSCKDSSSKSSTLFGLLWLNAEEIEEQKNNLSPGAFAFFDHDQISQLQLSQLSLVQIKGLFDCLSSSEAQGLLSQFDKEDVIEAIHANVLPKSVLIHVSENYFSDIKLDLLESSTWEGLFPTKYKKEEIQVDKNRFEHFDDQEVANAVLLNKFSRYCLSLLSHSQHKALILTKCDEKTLIEMFDNLHNKAKTEDNKKRFAELDDQEVANAVLFNKFSSYCLSLLSPSQYKAIKLTECDDQTINQMMFANPYDKAKTEEHKNQFAELDDQEVANAVLLNKFSSYCLSLLSPSQYKAIKLTECDDKTLSEMFDNPYDKAKNEERKKRFAELDDQEVAHAIQMNKFSSYCLTLHSSGQRRMVKLSECDSLTISNMFERPGSSYCNPGTEEQKKQFADFDVQEVVEAVRLNKLDSYCLSLLSPEQSSAVNKK